MATSLHTAVIYEAEGADAAATALVIEAAGGNVPVGTVGWQRTP